MIHQYLRPIPFVIGKWYPISTPLWQLALGSLGVGCLSRGIILPAEKKLWPPTLSPTFGTCERGSGDPIANCDRPFWADSGGLFLLPSSSSYLPANTRCLSLVILYFSGSRTIPNPFPVATGEEKASKNRGRECDDVELVYAPT